MAKRYRLEIVSGLKGYLQNSNMPRVIRIGTEGDVENAFFVDTRGGPTRLVEVEQGLYKDIYNRIWTIKSGENPELEIIELRFENQDSGFVQIIHCSKENVDSIISWYNMAHGGDDFKIFINNHEVEHDDGRLLTEIENLG